MPSCGSIRSTSTRLKMSLPGVVGADADAVLRGSRGKASRSAPSACTCRQQSMPAYGRTPPPRSAAPARRSGSQPVPGRRMRAGGHARRIAIIAAQSAISVS